MNFNTTLLPRHRQPKCQDPAPHHHHHPNQPKCPHCGVEGVPLRPYHKPNGIIEECYFRLGAKPGYEEFSRILANLLAIAILFGIPYKLFEMPDRLSHLLECESRSGRTRCCSSRLFVTDAGCCRIERWYLSRQTHVGAPQEETIRAGLFGVGARVMSRLQLRRSSQWK
jgi:hypothetical protein